MGDIAFRDEFIRYPANRVGGNGEADPDTPGVAGRENRRIDSDDLTLAVQKRSAGISVVDRGIRLDHVLDDSPVLRLNRTAERTDDSSCERAVQAKRISDGQDLLSDLKTL